ncbi:MAG TPA: DUF2339 domain-containing protein [Stellaceae bacterium]|nr:DUF2339 domain-containing protein [Stellaceae bacterium]
MWLLGAILGLAILSIPALWIVVLIRRDGDRELASRVGRLEGRVAALQHALDAAQSAPPAAAPAPAAPTAVEPAPPEARAPESPPPPLPAVPAPHAASGTAAAKPARERIEELIMRRWAVWLGGLALALGGIFLVKYSIEQGYFGPVARVTAGLLLGLVLLVASEAARRKPLAAPLGPVPVDYVPAALAAAAISVLFASLYVAYAVYELIGAGLAFPLLAGVSFGGAALSLVHGPFLALLGLAGAYVVPLLVSTNDPSVPRLLAYVLVVTAGSLFLVRWRQWPWLGWIAVAGSSIWTVLALIMATASDEIWIGLYLVLVAPLFPAAAGDESGSRARDAAIWSGAALSAVLMLAFVDSAHNDATSLAFAWLFTLTYAAFAATSPRFDRLAWIAAALQTLILADWQFGSVPFGAERFATLPPKQELGSYLTAAALTAASAGIGGFAMLPRTVRPQRWAALSAATPLAVLAVVYWRTEELGASLPWAILALILAAVFLAATEYVAARRATPGYTNALAYYALAVTGALALALTTSLRLGWLSIALSLELPAIAWLCERTGVRVLRHAASVLAAVVLVRLLLNPAVADYDLGTWPVANALLYLYGIPALAFAATARWLGRGRRDYTVLLLEAGALALTMALITLEIRHLVGGGRIDGEHYGLLEQALQTDAWLAAGYALLARTGAGASPVREFGWRIIAGIAAANLVLGVCLGANPLLMPEPVGDLPILDVLLLAYAVPAGLGVLYHRALASRGFGRLARGAGIAALALAFLYLSLEARHFFQGNRLDLGEASDGEWYAYSAVWLAFAAALLAAGIARGLPMLRLAGLVIGAIVAVKAFLFDMAALTGLYRAASFLGLGASLVALAWLYQRVAATPRESPP